MKKLTYFSILSFFLLVFSCRKEVVGTTSLDEKIDNALNAAGFTKADFMLPLDISDIPQSMDNPLTREKIELGASIFWDPIFHTNTVSQSNIQTISCGSCHITDGHAGVPQGLGEGGEGTGINGRQRSEDGSFLNGIENRKSLIDAQPIRVPTNMNVAYKPNTLWNGALGAPDFSRFINSDGLENRNFAVENSPCPKNDLGNPCAEQMNRAFPGFTGAEIQAMAGTFVHRMRFNEQIITEAGYREKFEEVYVNDPRTRIANGENPFTSSEFISADKTKFLEFGIRDTSNRTSNELAREEEVPIEFSRLAAAMAIAAYNRHVLPVDAPFQEYVRGDDNALTEQQKEGLVIFLNSGCVNCHNGPALTDGDFHAMGTYDLEKTFGQAQGRSNNPIAGGEPFLINGLDGGRAGVTKNPDDNFKFLTPTLYNIPFHVFHGSQEGGTRTAVNYMVNRQPQEEEITPFLDDQWRDNSGMDTDDREALIEFIENGLRDRKFDIKYRPGAIGGDLDPIFSSRLHSICSPNNDESSRLETGSTFCY